MKIVVKTVKFILKTLQKKHRAKLILVSLLLLISSVLELIGLGAILPVFSVLLEDNVVEKYTWASFLYTNFSLTNEKQLIVLLAIGLFLVIVIKNLLSLWINKFNTTFALGLSKEFSLKLHQLYYKKGFSYFKAVNSNVVVRNLRMATKQFAKMQVLGVLNLLNEFIVLILIIVFIAIYNFKILLLLAFTVIPVFLIFYFWVRKKSVELGHITNEITPILGKNMFQSIYGYVDVTIMGAEKQFRKKIKNNLDALVDVDVKTVIYNIAPTKVIESALMLAICVIISFGIYYLPSKTDMVKLLGLFAVAGYRIMPSINRIMIAINGLNRCHWVFDVFKPLHDESDKLITVKQKPLEFKKHLSLKNITFYYPDSEKPLFKDYNFKIEKGEVVGLVGPSGSGKTTLMNILLGFLKPNQGTYYIDETPLSEANKNSFYKKVGYVQQQVYLIDGTIAENVAFGCPKDDIDYKKLKIVLQRANLWDMVNDLPNNVEEMIGENGTKLSGGQRQRVGIARALYFDSEILFFDEATSSLDEETEKEITTAINNLSDGKLTIIIIAHRLTTLEHCDRIIEINNFKSNT
ncbi:ABC transporter ATP-binding protein [Winogradskyella sp. PG-2]|uniref:ABC transporter ATP-binding protein n=1 Tax=Winogradskyella sp. PG-2 TaxID=754409 RepID=UPI0004587EA2|nr:ABC transporter ATP-binding protein [Winogradskyella sp. PG-2]BAO76185.1 phospholipid-lipopolysaccharide ABC transporter [Winogradskyella sp. PG-2]